MLASAPNLSERVWLTQYPSDVPPHLEYPQEPLPWLLEEAARRFPARIACRYYRQELTYAELLDQSKRMAGALRARGLQPGDRVGLLMPNTPDYVISLFGTWLAGGVVVPINPLLVPEEVAALKHLTSCRFLVGLDLLVRMFGEPETGDRPGAVFVTSLADRLPWLTGVAYKFARLRRLGLFSRRLPSTACYLKEVLAATDASGAFPRPTPEDPALIMPTGGTTGCPKAVLLAHRNLLANAWQVNHWTGHKADASGILACLPFFHIYGLTACVLSGVALSATLVLHHRFQAEKIIRLIQRWRPSLVPVVPAMLVAFNKVLRKRPYDLRSVRAVISGGAALDPAVAAEFSRHTGATVVEGYGLSEASPVTHAGPLDGTARPGTIGLPLPDTDAMIVDQNTGVGPLPPGEVGELVVRGPQVMVGYWNEPEATARALQNGWLFTGDLATCSPDGFFRIVDRKKDLIITNGVNVHPTDVEHVLRGFDGIEDVAVIGVPDERHGELVKAVVVPKDGTSFNRRAFDAYAREHLEVHKRPRLVDVVPGPLPRNPLGKLLRRVLRDQFGRGTPATA